VEADREMIGKTINGKYEICQSLAESLMYEVYSALEVETGMPVAVKLMRGEMAENQERVKAFSDEVRLVAGISHPSIVPVLDFDLYEGRPFAVTEFTEGTDLRECIHAEKPLSFFDACRAVQQLAVLLQHACDQRVAVRSIKLSNIIRTNTGLIKVLSFSLPRLRLVGVGADEAAGIQSDLYFLGTTLYELIAGESPMRKRGGINEVWDDKLRQALRIRHSQLTPEQIEMVAEFVEKTLTRTVRNRFVDHAAFLVGLSDLMHVSGDAERVEREMKRRKLSTASEIVDAINGRRASATVTAAAAGSGAMAAGTSGQGRQSVAATASAAVSFVGASAGRAADEGVSSVPLKAIPGGVSMTGRVGRCAGTAALAVASDAVETPASALCPAEEMQLQGDMAAAAKPVLRLLQGGRDKAQGRSAGKIWQGVEEQPWIRHPYAAIGIGSFLLALFVSLLIFW